MPLTQAQLVTSIRRRLGWPSGDTFVSDAELLDMINQTRAELLDLMISIHQADYRSVVAQMPTVSGRYAYLIAPTNPSLTGSVPDLLLDVARVRKVALIVGTDVFPMKRWDVENSVDTLALRPWDSSTDIRYRISADVIGAEQEKLIYFTPTPNGVYTVAIWANVGLLQNTFSATDAINALGHDEYIILDGMLKCLQMEESDTSTVERQKARYIEMLQANGPPMDAGQPETVRDARGAEIDMDRLRRWW